MTAVAVVEDHEVVAVGLAHELVRRGHRVTVVPAGETSGMLAELRSAGPRMVVLDLDLGDGLDGAALIAPLLKRRCRVVVLTGNTQPVTHAACVAAGAEGVIAKQLPFVEIVDALDRSARGAPLLTATDRQAHLRLLREHLAAEASRIAPFQRLTRTEREILAGLMRGSTTAELAAERCVTHDTVRTQVRTLREKLGARSQLSAVAHAWRCGWSKDA